MDIAVQEITSMSSLIGQMGVAPQGGQYWSETVSEETSLPPDLDLSVSVPFFFPSKMFPSQQHCFKVHAYRVKVSGAGVLSIDGEDTPYDDFQVEVHKGMGAFLSPLGRFGVHFNYPAPASSTK